MSDASSTCHLPLLLPPRTGFVCDLPAQRFLSLARSFPHFSPPLPFTASPTPMLTSVTLVLTHAEPLSAPSLYPDPRPPPSYLPPRASPPLCQAALTALYPPLLAYAIGFIALPAARAIHVRRLNRCAHAQQRPKRHPPAGMTNLILQSHAQLGSDSRRSSSPVWSPRAPVCMLPSL
jgi:hypothetical protein